MINLISFQPIFSHNGRAVQLETCNYLCTRYQHYLPGSAGFKKETKQIHNIVTPVQFGDDN